jgi:hypothetical protein
MINFSVLAPENSAFFPLIHWTSEAIGASLCGDDGPVQGEFLIGPEILVKCVRVQTTAAYRKTPLFDRFLSFDVEARIS